jgi:hypothetical protein
MSSPDSRRSREAGQGSGPATRDRSRYAGSVGIRQIIFVNSKATPGHAGSQDWLQDIDPMGKSWEIDAQREEVSLPHVSLHCPEIHTHSHTQQWSGRWESNLRGLRFRAFKTRGLV